MGAPYIYIYIYIYIYDINRLRVKITSSFPRDTHDIPFINITVFGLRVIWYLTKKKSEEIFLPTVNN